MDNDRPAFDILVDRHKSASSINDMDSAVQGFLDAEIHDCPEISLSPINRLDILILEFTRGCKPNNPASPYWFFVVLHKIQLSAWAEI